MSIPPTTPSPRGAARLRPTARGWAFAAAALVVLVGAPLLGQRDILRIGVLLAVLCLAAAWTASRAARTLDLVSRSSSGIVEAGVPSSVRLTVSGRGRAGARVVLEDRVPLALGGTVRLAVPHLHEGETLDLEHSVRSDVRGSFTVGPAVLVARDVFGLVTARRPVGGTALVDVLPRVHPLRDLVLGDAGGSRGSSTGAAATGSPDDVSIREYRVGDDLRRVHWRSTARRGAVMVRSDEHPGRPDVVLLLDDRAVAHAGRGAASSLEWAVTAAASAAVHLHRRGPRVQLLHGGTFDPPRELDDSSAARGLLRALARLRPGAEDGLARSTAALGRGDSTLLVAVLGRVDEADVAPLLSARPAGVPALAVLQRTSSWSGPATGSGTPVREPGLERAQLVLARAGWRTAVAAAGDDVGEVWGRLAGAGGGRAPAAGRGGRGARERAAEQAGEQETTEVVP